MINAYHEPLDFEIQEGSSGGWRRAIDTGLDSPLDIAEPGQEAPVASLRYRVAARSVVVLVGRDGHGDCRRASRDQFVWFRTQNPFKLKEARS